MLFNKLDTGKVHGLDTSNVLSPFVSRRDKPSGIWAYYYYIQSYSLQISIYAS